MKKKKNKFFLILIAAAVVILSGWWINRISWKGDDFLFMEVFEDRLTLINISPVRGMINSLEISGAVDLWIPNGMGWYPASKLKLILDQEKNQPNLGKITAFYNFGFWPELVESGDNWRTNQWLWKNLGPLGWLRFRLQADDWLQKNESINRQLPLEKENLEEIMSRDMADNLVIEKNIRLAVVNASGKNGFGNMVADRLGWWGMMVTAVDTSEETDECRISYRGGFPTEKEISQILAKILSCRLEEKEGGGMEVVLGRETERMVKYSETYVRTF
jgi:hypothetical protein